jgi:hypothetical protein
MVKGIPDTSEYTPEMEHATVLLRVNPTLSVPPQLTLRRVASKLSDPHLHGERQTRPGEIDTIGLGERLHHYK